MSLPLPTTTPSPAASPTLAPASTATTALSLRATGLWILTSAVAFHIAFLVPGCGWAIVLFLFGTTHLTRAPSARTAFYGGFLLGLLCYPYHLSFFYTIFHGFAIALWMILPFWLALYTWLGWLARKSLPPWAALAILPFLWLGLEYFRCELYPLSFGWLTPALALSDHPPAAMLYALGGFGLSALLVALVVPLTDLSFRRPIHRIAAMAVALLIALLANLPRPLVTGGYLEHRVDFGAVELAGVQTETLMDTPTLAALESARAAHPTAAAYVLSENAFTGPPPDAFRAWCRSHQATLIAGGSELRSRVPRRKYNTAFVIGPTGETIFSQVKSRPIQFFDDGISADSQEVWNAPFGRAGICICYDLSYTEVLDAFAAKGAQIMVVPTMDVYGWGEAEHMLHARVAPIRAAEYGLPIFRLSSSGISQAVTAEGDLAASAPFASPDAGAPAGEMLVTRLQLAPGNAHVPLDRTLAPFAVYLPLLILLWAAVQKYRNRPRHPRV